MVASHSNLEPNRYHQRIRQRIEVRSRTATSQLPSKVLFGNSSRYDDPTSCLLRVGILGFNGFPGSALQASVYCRVSVYKSTAYGTAYHRSTFSNEVLLLIYQMQHSTFSSLKSSYCYGLSAMSLSFNLDASLRCGVVETFGALYR